MPFLVCSSGHLATLFRGGESTTPITAYVPPKQPKKGISSATLDQVIFFSVVDAAPRVMIATVIQAFS